jgi:ABC-type glycerol-3-phosphate transport system substrate-binding protein
MEALRTRARRPLSMTLMMLLGFVACSGGDERDTAAPSAVQAITWTSGASITLQHNSPGRVKFTWPLGNGGGTYSYQDLPRW